MQYCRSKTSNSKIVKWCPSGYPVVICLIGTHWKTTWRPLEAHWLPTILSPVAFQCRVSYSGLVFINDDFSPCISMKQQKWNYLHVSEYACDNEYCKSRPQKKYIKYEKNPNICYYGFKHRETSYIRCTLEGKKLVDHSDVVGASPVGAAPTTSSFWTQNLASVDWKYTTARRDTKYYSFVIWCV